MEFRGLSAPLSTMYYWYLMDEILVKAASMMTMTNDARRNTYRVL